MYMYNCEWQKQFRNMTEIEPKQVKPVCKNTEHCDSKNQYCSYLYG